MSRIEQCEGQTNLVDGNGMTGKDMVALADKWAADNWIAWNKMLNQAAEYVSQGKRFSMERLLQFVRYDCETSGTSQGFKVNNNTRAALTRKMLRKYPTWERYVDKRDSKVDWL